ncbi:glycoside hydrolase family 3 C-terminal domain-containing protein [Changpingibacter yushuensis]|uniref:glycoside hydrolase family 3 C-terminal domain-containing protein n=1 Tax=Changpingibacter yushuensis TaxID=2758440 RepID=UPI0015F49771|nr:glycoside hydrolase family 3 C-terminal domain-containing protein [Changpingibacter yushuensis]
MAEHKATDLTLEEKAALTSGADFWTTEAIERADVPSVMVTDGPYGLRKQAGASDNLGLSESVPATCFPPAVALGSSLDPELAEQVGVALGEECRAEDVAVLLGPAINIKRSPLCGRNFEYYSEDPLVSGELGSAFVRGVQSQGVGTSLKHFAANNQEQDRMRISSEVDARTLREIYLRGFERVVRESQPWTVMCSYNKINGVYASEDPWLLTTVLRDEWGFEGLVVSDWGAVNDRVVGLPAGLDLEMPSSGGRTDAQLVAAVKDGSLDESFLDIAAQRVLDLVDRAQLRPALAEPWSVDAHHALAREVARRCLVLLKNEGGLLPLQPSTRVAVIGEFARTPRFQGGGSSHINPTRVDSALDAIRELADDGRVSFAPGFTLDGSGDSEALTAEAVAAASTAEVAVVFLGLPDFEESEGYDRTHINLPAAQLELLKAVVAANPNTVVVLSNGAVVALPFRDSVPAILEGWLLGQAGGGATADVLYGVANPSGRLTETIPLRLQDNPSYGNFPGELGKVRYGEGGLVGYRWYDAKDIEVAFPFGHGLSYTTFEYAHPTARILANGNLEVGVRVTNTGKVAGREIVQVYTGFAGSSVVERAPRELRKFVSVQLDAGESRQVQVEIARNDLAYWDVRVDGWIVEGGTYRVEVGASSRDIRGSAEVSIDGDVLNIPITRETAISELVAHPVAGKIVSDALALLGGAPAEDGGEADASALGAESLVKLMGSLPVGRLIGFSGGQLTDEMLDHMIEAANAAIA